MNKIHLQKEAKHGTPQFPFQAFSQHDTCGQYFAPYHWHDEAEFLYVTEGSIMLRTESDTKILSAGQVCFINPGTAHALFGSSDISHHYALVFNLELLSFAQYDVCQNRYLEPLFSGKLLFPSGDSSDAGDFRENRTADRPGRAAVPEYGLLPFPLPFPSRSSCCRFWKSCFPNRRFCLRRQRPLEILRGIFPPPGICIYKAALSGADHPGTAVFQPAYE